MPMFEFDFPVVPDKTALLNVDMQNCFVEGYPTSAPDGLDVLERINKLADVCRKAGIQIIHTSHVVRPDGSNIGVLGQIIPPVKDGMINKGSESAALHSKLVIADEDILLDKPRFGAFHGTDLELLLRARDIDTVIVTGITTNVCCETTAREANVRDFKVFFTSDGTSTFATGDLSKGEIQKASLTTLGQAFAKVISVDELIRKIEASAGIRN